MNNELLTVISYLERDRGVDREVIIQAIESALQQAGRKSMSGTGDVRMQIDRKTFDIRTFELRTVSDIEVGHGFITLRRAREINPAAQPGDTVEVEGPAGKLGRIAAQTARQMIVQKLRQAERENVFDEFKDRIGDIVSGSVRQIIHRDLIVELGKVEAIIPGKDRIPTEEYQVGDRIRAYVHSVQANANGPDEIRRYTIDR